MKKPTPENVILPAALRSAGEEAKRLAEEAAAQAAAEEAAAAEAAAAEAAAAEEAALKEAEAEIQAEKKEGDE
jgi:large subunit ribosomal protein L3